MYMIPISITFRISRLVHILFLYKITYLHKTSFKRFQKVLSLWPFGFSTRQGKKLRAHTDGTMHLASAAANLQKLFSLNNLITIGFKNTKVLKFLKSQSRLILKWKQIHDCCNSILAKRKTQRHFILADARPINARLQKLVLITLWGFFTLCYIS